MKSEQPETPGMGQGKIVQIGVKRYSKIWRWDLIGLVFLEKAQGATERPNGITWKT